MKGKKIFKRNQVIATVLAVMIAVAGYLTYANQNPMKQAGTEINPDSEQILLQGEKPGGDIVSPEEGQEDALSADAQAETKEIESQETETGANPGEAVLVNSVSADNIAAAAKLNREQVRAKSKQTLQEIIDNNSLNDAAKEEAVQKLVELTENEEREAAAENLLTAKGYSNSVVTITDGKVDVAVGMDNLSDMNRAQIEDIIKRKTGVEVSSIYITPIQEEAKK